MKVEITNALIASQPAAPEKQYEIRDTKLTGLILMVYPSGKATYYMEYARKKREKLGSAEALTPSAARKKGQKILADYVANEVDPVEERKKAKTRTLGLYLRNVYAPEHLAKRSRPNRTLRRIEKCFADFLDLPLDKISPFLIQKYQTQKLKAEVKESTINRDVAELRTALSKAVEWSIIPVHPFASAKPLKVDRKPNIRYLRPEEEKALYEALDRRESRRRTARSKGNRWRAERNYELLPEFGAYTDHMVPLIATCLHTGIRQGEAFDLHWTDIDLSQSTLTVQGDIAKSKQTRHVQLNSEIVEVLSQWKSCGSGKGGFVFPNPVTGKRLTTVKTAWGKILKDAKIENFRFHDLRHTFASKLVMAGVPLNTVRELCGHQSLEMTLRYAHLASEHKREAVELLVSNH